jgi:nucleoside-diphosphate-sugar epimerase
MALYLVTGGAGFIGSHIVDELVRRGERVRVLDNFSSGKRENLDQISNSKFQPSTRTGGRLSNLQVVEGDIRDRETVQRTMTGVDYVLHHAAMVSVPGSVADPLTTNEVNVAGTLNVLQAARDAGVKRVVFASSSAVYGDEPTLPKREEMPVAPLSPYAASKVSGELYCRVFCEMYGLPTVALRYFNVFGPRQDPASQYAAVIPKFITALLRCERPTIYGDGTQSRDFIYVANVVQANLLACEKDAAVGKVMNVASGEGYTLLDLYQDVAEWTGTTLQPIVAPPRAGDVKHSVAAVARITQLLDYAPTVDRREGLRRTVEWYAGRKAALQIGPLTD